MRRSPKWLVHNGSPIDFGVAPWLWKPPDVFRRVLAHALSSRNHGHANTSLSHIEFNMLFMEQTSSTPKKRSWPPPVNSILLNFILPPWKNTLDFKTIIHGFIMFPKSDINPIWSGVHCPKKIKKGLSYSWGTIGKIHWIGRGRNLQALPWVFYHQISMAFLYIIQFCDGILLLAESHPSEKYRCVRQLGSWNSQYFWVLIFLEQSHWCSKPPTSNINIGG